MIGIRNFGWRAAGSLALSMVSMATPPDTIRKDEVFFGAGEGGYAVLQTISDNKGSYYIDRTTTMLIERSTADGSVKKEIPLLDREEIVDATYEGPGKAPVKVVIHSKDDGQSLASVIARWPHRGRKVEGSDLTRLTLHDAGLKLAGRLELLAGKPSVERLTADARKVSGWKVDEGIEWDGALLLKLTYQEKDGDSDAVWISTGAGTLDQVRAFRDLQPEYLTFGEFGSSDEAVAEAAKISGTLKEKKLAGLQPNVWKTSDGGEAARFAVVVAQSQPLMNSGKVPEMEGKLGLKLGRISSSRFQEWVPVPGQ